MQRQNGSLQRQTRGKTDVFLKFMKFDRVFHVIVKSFTPRDGAKVVLLCLGFPNCERHCEEVTGQKKRKKKREEEELKNK